jgi:hypothetical protein
MKDSVRNSRTPKLWLEYGEMIQLMRNLLKSERLGLWLEHLNTCKELLPYLLSAGHNLYAKSLTLYIDEMEKLPFKKPDLYQCFLQGLHVVRRNERYWGGSSTDLIIESTLNRDFKETAGPTRGSGVTEDIRNVWLASRPDCAQVNNCMQTLTGQFRKTSEQNKDVSSSRQKRDWSDLKLLLQVLQNANPFHIKEGLVNICNDVHASEKVDVDNCRQIGLKAIKEMDEKQVSSYTFKRKKTSRHHGRYKRT